MPARLVSVLSDVAVLGLLVLATGAHAQCVGYPARPVTVIVAFPAGGPADAVARVVTQAMTQSTGKPFIVVNRGGAGGNVGAMAATTANPDGYTILLTTSALAVAPSFYNLSFDPQTDLKPIAQVAAAFLILEVPTSLPVRAVSDLVALARGAPGKLNFASAGTGTPLQLAGELFKRAAAIDIVHVPYQGSAPALQDLMAGRASLMFDATLSSVPLIKAGLLRALAVTAPERLAELPDVPTMAEAGYPSVDIGVRYWLMAPKGVPACAAQFIEGLASQVLAEPVVKSSIANLGAEATWQSSQQVSDTLSQEIPRWRQLAQNLAVTRSDK